MCPAHRLALGAVDSRGVPVAETLDARLVPVEANLTAVARAEIEGTSRRLDSFHDGPLGGDEGAPLPGSQGDDLVPGPVGIAAGTDHLRT
jgi:hypothetical protein